jgi:hypothetical protein
VASLYLSLYLYSLPSSSFSPLFLSLPSLFRHSVITPTHAHTHIRTSKGESSGPRIEACQWKTLSLSGPAEQTAGGSLRRSRSSLIIRFCALPVSVAIWIDERGDVLSGDGNGKRGSERKR